MATVPELPRNCNSWVAVSRKTGQPVIETFECRVVELIDEERFEVLPTLAWLQRFNAKLRKEK